MLKSPIKIKFKNRETFKLQSVVNKKSRTEGHVFTRLKRAGDSESHVAK